MAYFPLYLAWRGFGAAEIAWVLALPQIVRIFAPAGWGWLADRTGAQRAHRDARLRRSRGRHSPRCPALRELRRRRVA